MCGMLSNMKSSWHKTWQTSLLFLKPLQIQNLKRKKWGDMTYYVPPVWKIGGTRPPCPPPNCAHGYNQHRAVCPGAWQVLDSTWSTERGRQGPPVVPAGWCHPHTSNESWAWLQQRFPNRRISRGCDPQCSPHSRDLNPPDFYMWGYLKNRVYGNNLQTIPDLKVAITPAVRAIPREECGRVIESFARRIQMCLQRRRAQLEHTFWVPVKQSFYSIDLKLWRCLLHRLNLM